MPDLGHKINSIYETNIAMIKLTEEEKSRFQNKDNSF